MQEPLKNRAMKALSWSFVQEAIMRLLQFGISVLLARLLMPAQFGLLAMLSVFIGFAQALVDGGFASALIQRRDPNQLQICSIFYFNLFGSLLLAAMLYAAAPWISAFYHQPMLVALLRVMAFLPLINGLGLVQNTLLVKELDVRKQTIILAAGTLFSGAVAVILAWRGFGVWSLVAQQFTQSIVRVVLLWTLNTWRPSWLFGYKVLRELFAFGGGMLCSGILASVYDNLYPLLIGKFFSAGMLGFFNRAQSLQTIASQSLGGIANRVTFPLFSKLQDEPARFRKGLRNAITAVTFVHFPMMIGLAVVSKPLILLVFTDKWAASIPYLQLLAIVGMLYPLHVLNLNVLMALGRSDLFLRLEIFKVTIFISTALITFRWGIMALIWGQLFCELAGYYLNTYYSKLLINYSIWDQLRDIYPAFLASVLMGFAVILASSILPTNNFLQLGFRVILGVAVYFLICRGMRLRVMHETLDLIRRRQSSAAPVINPPQEQAIP